MLLSLVPGCVFHVCNSLEVVNGYLGSDFALLSLLTN